MAETKDIVERLFYACVGHPAALIPWPDRLLQDAAAEIARLRAEVAALRESAALRDVAAERRRQVEAEGWTTEHDDQHRGGELALAAGVYALGAACPNAQPQIFARYWPGWAQKWWKPRTAREDLVRAGALIVAEIERLDRIAAPPAQEPTP